MEIEKLTFHKIGIAASRSTEHSLGHRLVSISIPRVKWLEADGPYVPDWAVPYKDEEDVKPHLPDSQKVKRRGDANGKRLHRVNVNMPVTALEKAVGELIQGGFSSREAATKLGLAWGSVKDASYRYKLKMGLIPMPE